MNKRTSTTFPSSFKCTLLFLLFFCSAGLTNHSFGQNTSSFYPIAEHSYDIKDGLPDLFVQNVLLDKVGRLHMNTGGVGTTAFGENYYEYDGTRAYLAGLDIKNPRFFRLLLEGKDS